MENTAIQHPPRTLMEVYRILPEGTWVQLVENELMIRPTPLVIHQEMLGKIIAEIYGHLKDNPIGEVILGPFDTYIDEYNAYQPDILYVRNENKDLIKEDGLYGTPDLVVEILDPPMAKYDLYEKKNVYERSGVKEYWIVDPKSKEVEGYFLENGSFGESLIDKGKIHSRLLDQEFSF